MARLVVATTTTSSTSGPPPPALSVSPRLAGAHSCLHT